MIFLLDRVGNKYEVLVYQDLSDLAHRVEWQDICEGKSIITDLEGNKYKWDDSKSEEYATVHNYTLIKTGEKLDCIDRLKREYYSSDHQGEFEIEV